MREKVILGSVRLYDERRSSLLSLLGGKLKVCMRVGVVVGRQVRKRFRSESTCMWDIDWHGMRGSAHTINY